MIIFVVKKTKGTYGTSLVANVPPIASGTGYISAFDLSLKRRYSLRGEKRSYVSASCPLPGGVNIASFPLRPLDLRVRGRDEGVQRPEEGVQGQRLGAGLNASMRTVCVALALSMMATVSIDGMRWRLRFRTSSRPDRVADGAGRPRRPLDPNGADERAARRTPSRSPRPKPASPPGHGGGDRGGAQGLQGQDADCEVREEFIGAAEAEAGLNEGQKQMVGEHRQVRKAGGKSPNFAAGQLAAGVYEATLPEKQRIAGYQGCVYELALQLRRELAKKKG